MENILTPLKIPLVYKGLTLDWGFQEVCSLPSILCPTEEELESPEAFNEKYVKFINSELFDKKWEENKEINFYIRYGDDDNYFNSYALPDPIQCLNNFRQGLVDQGVIVD